jgi:hypothetical protein
MDVGQILGRSLADGFCGPSVNADENDMLGYGRMAALGSARNACQNQE